MTIRVLLPGVLLVGCALPSTASSTSPAGARSAAADCPVLSEEPASDDWQAYVNGLRVAYGVNPVRADGLMSSAAWLHARYMVEVNEIGHQENAASPWYTPDGDRAARNSVLHVENDAGDFRSALAGWQQAPFHIMSILDPEAADFGYGDYNEASPLGIAFGAALMVNTGRGVEASPRQWPRPLVWPPHGHATRITRHWGEWPDPLRGCPDYTKVSGLPLWVSFGRFAGAPEVARTRLESGDGAALEHCAFTEATYTDREGDATNEKYVRFLLESDNPVVIMPRRELEPGETYHVGVELKDGREASWCFRVAAGGGDAASR